MLENETVVIRDILSSDNRKRHYGLFQMKFPVQFEGNEIATIDYHSSKKIVFDAVKYSFMIVLVNAVIKMVLLWWLVVWASNRYLVRSLNHFIDRIIDTYTGSS
ncbi:MAG: hypothetical protein GY744_13825 [Gammaproteobacteria bacterium]|nr:hypothetical protein [Gammaproteobacteria bacterium]